MNGAGPTASPAQAASDFRVFSTSGEIPGITFYLIESTAPDNVEIPDPSDGSVPGLKPVDPDDAVKEIARALIPPDEPEVDANLVVMVHGFNTPRPQVLDFYGKAIEALQKDKDVIFDKSRRVVCVGYRWPSESIFSIIWSTISALPIFLVGAGVIAVLVLVLRSLELAVQLSALLVDCIGALAWPAIAILGFVLAAALLRAVVYFRDNYRATNYGVPDLVEVIRQIDREATKLASERGGAEARRRIALSFIGHSMGGLVVTNAIRVLSDVFNPNVIRTHLSGKLREDAHIDAPERENEVEDKIGHVFALKRFILTSPDIPAETLLSDRANFLASSLRRFREAYLFSNEGDEVLRQVSRIANYFSFPTTRRSYGYRLGNAEILSSTFGDVQVPHPQLLRNLRVGDKTLAELSDDTTLKHAAAVAKAFTYFDCTDYVDGNPERGLLTQAKNYKARNRFARIPVLEQLNLLWQFFSGKIDCHSGYYKGAVAQRLIYRLACLGFDEAVKAYGDEPALYKELADHQIRMVKSVRLGPGFYERRVQHETMGRSVE